MNNEMPLGLPEGSVRAILAIVIIGGWLAACFVGVPTETLTAMSGLTGVVANAYYSTRQQQKLSRAREDSKDS